MNIHPSPIWNDSPAMFGTNGVAFADGSPTTSLPFQFSPHPSFQHPNGFVMSTPPILPMQTPVAAPGGLDLDQQYVQGVNSPLSHHETSTPPVNGTGASCCGPSASASSKHTPTSSTGSAPSSSTTATSGSCCSGKKVDAKENSGLAMPVYQASNGVNGLPVPKANGVPLVQVPLPNGETLYAQVIPQMFPSYAQQQDQVVYTYPAAWGTMSSPLQPNQWKQSIASMMYEQNVPSELMSAGSGPPEPSFHTNGHTPAATPVTSHVCSCGDSCDCLGCAAHPYNETTQNYVRSAVASMMDNHSHQQQQPQQHQGRDPATVVDGSGAPMPNVVSSPVLGGAEPSSPQQAQTPSDASGISEDQPQLSSNDYFFVDYPILGCGGETNTCPCGDDCQCFGCLVHSTPELLSVPGS
jgi:hypothetical protein